jgi:hypothetical protein
MTPYLRQFHVPALPATPLAHWLQRLGIGPAADAADEASLDGATIVAQKADLRALRKEASRRAEKPPLPML